MGLALQRSKWPNKIAVNCSYYISDLVGGMAWLESVLTVLTRKVIRLGA